MRKIELLQVGKTYITENFTVYSACIYYKKMSVSVVNQLASPITTIFSGSWDSGESITPIAISGVNFENVSLSKLSSVEELYLQDGSFYFDEPNQDLYIAIFDYRNLIINHTFPVGQTIGFLSEAQLVNINGINYPLNTYIGSVYYEPRLNDVSINESISDQKHGIFVFGDLQASIKNNDGAYDFITDSITGNKAVLLVANLSDSKEEEQETGFPYKLSAEAADFKIARTGIVENVDYSDPDNPNIIAIDTRADWTQTIGTNLLTVAEFPNLPDKYINDRKAICIGKVNGVKCVPLRDNTTAADFDYLICDTSIGEIQSISAVYFKGKIGTSDVDRYLAITSEYTVDLATGIITIINAVKGDVFVYGVFTALEETVEIILFLLSTYANIAYIDSNFNKAEIEVIRGLNYLTHVYVQDKGMELYKVVEKLITDIQCDMIQQEDVLTIRQSNVERLSSESIENYQIIDNPPKWDNNRTDTIKTITINYDYDYREKLYNTYYDDSLLQFAIDENRKAVDESFNVNLVSSANVESIYTTFYSRFVKVPRTVTINRTFAFSSGLSDFVTFEVTRNTLSSWSKQIEEEEIKTLTDGTVKAITTGEAKAAVLVKSIKIPVAMEKVIFSKALYKITKYDEINNTIEAVYFKDSTDLDYFSGGDSTTDYDYIISGSSTTNYDYYSGGNA